MNRPTRAAPSYSASAIPRGSVHSVQVEINRGLYLDEVRVEKTAGFDALQRALMRLTRAVADGVA